MAAGGDRRAFAIGLLLGSLLLVKRANRRWGRAVVVFAGFLLLGASMSGCGLLTHFFELQPGWFACLTLPLLLIGGTGLVMVTVNTSTVRMLATPDHYRNRIGAATSFISGMVIPLVPWSVAHSPACWARAPPWHCSAC